MIPDWEQVALKMRALTIHVNEEKWQNRYVEVAKWRNYMSHRYNDYSYKRPELVSVYKAKPFIGLDMLRQFRKQYPDIDLPLAMDGGYTSAAFCKIVDQELRNEKKKFFKTTVHFKGQSIIYYAYCATHRIKGFEKKQRLVIAFRKEDLSDTPYCSISNRTHWHASGILRIRRHRWPIETFHQEGKDEGLDKYQVRNFKAILSNIACVCAAYTMLKCAIHDDELMSTFRQRLPIGSDGTLPLLRRLLQLEGLIHLIELVHLKVNQGQSVESIIRQVIHPAC